MCSCCCRLLLRSLLLPLSRLLLLYGTGRRTEAGRAAAGRLRVAAGPTPGLPLPLPAPPPPVQVRLKEFEGALREYKKENGKFFEMKERYKASIAGLEKEVQVRAGCVRI